jgi:SAM-dependent methyltransferase
MDELDPVQFEERTTEAKDGHRACILCGAPMQRQFQKDGFWIVECERCQHRSTELKPSAEHVVKVYGDDYFEGGGAGYSNYLEEGALLKARGRSYGDLLNRHTEPGRLLDVGAAAGFVLAGLEESGWKGVGLEPNAKMVGFARDSLHQDVRKGSLEDFQDPAVFDVVTMIQVLPHFFDPRRALERAAALTRPGGLWLIETWNRGSWTSRLLGKNWHEYSPPSVLHWFSSKGIIQLAGDFAFTPIAQGRPSKKILGSHARSLLEHAVRDTPLLSLIKVVGRVIPESAVLPYPAEDLVWMLFRKRSD